MNLQSKYSFILFFLIICFVKNVESQTLQVTINKKSGQENRSISPVVFTVVFSAPINVGSFTAASVKLNGTALGKTLTAITQVAPNDGTTFEITVSAATNNGTIEAEIPAAFSSYTSATLGSTGSFPQGITMDGSGNVYTANSGSNNVTKITPAGVSSVFGITGNHPYGITKDASGNIYTSNAYAGSITKITPLGVATTFATTTSHPYNININDLGDLYMTNLYASTLSKISSAGVTTSLFGITGSSPFDLTIDVSGNIYTANNGSNDVSKITANGISTIFGTTGSGPDGITIDPSGNLYTVNLYDNTVTRITSDGISSIFGTTGSGPTAITIDATGNLYTANGGSGNISKITPAGVSTIIGTTGNNPVSITLDATGNIYTANNADNTVSKLVPSGIAISGSNTPSNLASTSTNNIYVLPVKLLSFTSINKNCAAIIAWKTAAEINSNYYSIETSTDGTEFIEAAKIASKNSAEGASYTYTFNEILIGTTYYRLKLVDNNGDFSLSNSIIFKANENCLARVKPTVSPSPANDFVIVKNIASGTHINLINTAGIILKSIKATGNTQRINLSPYSNGIFILRLEDVNGNIQTVKVVKL